MRLSNEIERMIVNANAVIEAVRRDINAGLIKGDAVADAMASVATAQKLILKAVDGQRKLWREQQRRHRGMPSGAGRIL
jgi:hypothetical protein